MDEDAEKTVIEDTAVTPFFKRHGSHMPSTFNLHANIRETGKQVFLEMDHPGLEDGSVKVEGDVNTIKVKICFDDECPDTYFTNTYVMESPIDSDGMQVELLEDKLKVTANKVVEEDD